MGVAMLVALVGAAPADADAACALRGSTTVVASERARVFLTTDRRTEVQTLYGCLFRAGKRVRLGRFGDREYFGLPRLAGAKVAFRRGSGGTGSVGTGVRVFDLRSRRRVFGWDAPAASTLCARGQWGIADIALKPNGSVAWLMDDDPGCNDTPGRFEIYKHDRPGAALLVDSGDDIERDSLAWAGTQLYWTRGGAARSAAFE